MLHYYMIMLYRNVSWVSDCPYETMSHLSLASYVLSHVGLYWPDRVIFYYNFRHFLLYSFKLIHNRQMHTVRDTDVVQGRHRYLYADISHLSKQLCLHRRRNVSPWGGYSRPNFKNATAYMLILPFEPSHFWQNFDRFTVKHALQNTHNDYHQWLSHSSEPHQIRFRPSAGKAYSAPQTH